MTSGDTGLASASSLPDIGVMLPRDLPAAQVVPFARRVEELGFAELWVVEDLGFRGGVAQAAVALASTVSVRVGVGILPAAVRSPAFEAMELATLAELFPGRLVAGVGHGMPGWMRSVGAWPDRPLALLREHVAAVRALLRGETVSVDDAGVVLDGVRLESPPTVPPPVILGVRGPRSLALSGRIADGTVLAEPVTPEYLGRVREAVGEAPGHRLVGYAIASVGDDPVAAVDAARPGLEWVGEPDWAPHIDPLPYAADLAGLRTESTDRRSFARALPEAWVRDLAVTGTPAEARRRLGELGAAGLDCAVLLPVGDDPLAALPSLARVLDRSGGPRTAGRP